MSNGDLKERNEMCEKVICFVGYVIFVSQNGISTKCK